MTSIKASVALTVLAGFLPPIAGSLHAAENESETAGVVRISDRDEVRTVGFEGTTCPNGTCPPTVHGGSTVVWEGGDCPDESCSFCNRCRYCNNGPLTGSELGCFRYNYPVNPYYFDQRDGRVFSAVGYGVPLAVPLAPNVHHTYNYGWGIPSSRITPVSRMPGQN